MPTYEYTCRNCGQSLEVFQSFSDKPLKKHKECGGELQKVFHARGIVFKGSGFYATDSKPKTSSTKTGDTKADTKTDAKKPAKVEAKTSTSSDD